MAARYELQEPVRTDGSCGNWVTAVVNFWDGCFDATHTFCVFCITLVKHKRYTDPHIIRLLSDCAEDWLQD